MKNNIFFFDVCNLAYIPLVKAVYQRGYPLVMNKCGLREHLRGMGVDLLPFEGFFPTDILPYTQKTTVDVMTNLLQALKMPGMNDAFSSPLGNFLAHTGKGFFEELSSLIGAEILTIEAFESLVSQCDVSLVVLGCDNSPSQRALIKVANGFKIPTLHLAHGIPTKSCYGVAGEMGELYADFLASFGEIHRVRLTANEVSRERIFLTGSPLWDSLYKESISMSKEHACRELGLKPDCPVVLFCTSGTNGSSPHFPGKCRKLFDLHQAVLQAVAQVGPEVQLLVRPHPNEIGRAYYSEEDLQWLDQAYERWAVTRHHVNVRVIRDKKNECIRAADLVMTVPSNVISEAMILQCPVIAMPLSSEGYGEICEEHQGTEVVHDKTQIYPMIKKLLDSPSKRKEVVKRQNAVLPDVNFGHDGKAFERVTALVEKLAVTTISDSAQLLGENQQSNPLRILLAAHNFPPHSYAGTELYTYNVAKALQNRGHEVTVLYPVIVDDSQNVGSVAMASYEDLTVARLNLRQIQVRAVCNEKIKPEIREFLLKNPVDVVHIQHLIGLSLSFVEVLEELNIPIVLTANDFWILCEQIHLLEPSGNVCAGPETIDKCVRCVATRDGGFSENQIASLFHYFTARVYDSKRTLKKVDLLLCPSKFLLKMFTVYGYEAKKMIHAPQGANLFTPIKVFDSPLSPIVFSYLGHFAYRKGLDILVDAINRVEATNAEFRIYGVIVEPGYFVDTISKIKNGKKIIFCGAYSSQDLPKILSETHIAIIPSRGENYPFVIREVLHGGVPVIASSVAGIPEIIQDGVNGFLFNSGSVDDLTLKINAIIQAPHLIAEMKGNIQPVKSIEQDVVEFERHYASVISSNSKPQLTSRINAHGTYVSKKNKMTLGSEVQDEKNCRKSTSEKMFAVSIIIPVFNKLELTQQCLVQLARVTDGVTYEVIIVDNNSTDGTREFLDTLDGDVQIIRNNENVRFAIAGNQGTRAARGMYFVFLNNDTIPQPGWLEALVHEADSDPDVAVVGSKLLYPDNSVQHAGIMFNRKTGLPCHWANGIKKDSPLVSQRRKFKAVTSACMLVKREVFERIEGFDEAYINGYEDVDLCLKIERENQKTIYQPKSWLYHLERQTDGGQDHMDHNRDLFLSRWGNVWLEDQDIVAYDHGCAMVQSTVGQNQEVRIVPLTNDMERVQWSQVVNVQKMLHGSMRDSLDQGQRRGQLYMILSEHDQWPMDLGVLEWGGYVCEVLGFEQNACEFWRKLVKIGKHNDARRSLIRSAIRRGQLDEAQEHLDVLKQQVSLSIEDVILQGTLFIQRQEYDKAKIQFEDGLAKDPMSQKVRLGLGMAMLGQEKLTEALEVFRAILKDYPDDQEAIHWVVRAGTEIKDWIRIAEQLEKFLIRNPANCDIRFALAGVYFQGEMKEKSQIEYETLRLLKPDYEGLDDLARSLSVSSPCNLVFDRNEGRTCKNVVATSFSQPQAASTVQQKNVAALVSDPICGAVRLVSPLLACIETLGVQGKVFNSLENENIKNTLPTGPEEVWLSQRTNVINADTLKVARNKGTRIVHDIDDLVWKVPDDNPNASLERVRSLRMREFLPSVDCVTVSTDPIKNFLATWGIESIILPNCLFPKDWFGLSPQRRVGHRPRVGWAGQTGVHNADLALLNTVMELMEGEVEWVFLGDAPEYMRNSRILMHVYPMADFDDYPRALANLHLDVALAPLEHNEFNEAKSDIRILQYGILGYPVIATDIYPHRQAPIERVHNDTASWVQAIRNRIYDLDEAQAEGEKLRQWVLANRMIENYLPQYQEAWFGLPDRFLEVTSDMVCGQGVEVIHDRNEDVRQFTAVCSIIIPVFNKMELTQQCLAQLVKVTDGLRYEVIIVDNNSTDGTIKFLETLDGDVQIIRNKDNLGFAKACNQGAHAARGKYLIFLNNDTIPQSGWLSALVDEAETDDNIAVVGSKLLYEDGILQHAGVVISRSLSIPYHIYRGLPSDNAFANRRREFQAVTAACMLVKRTWFDSVGGFDEAYRNGFEDVDLCLNIREKGGKVVYQPKSWLYHLEGRSPGRNLHNDHNIALFQKKWSDKYLVDEDCVAFDDGIALLVNEQEGSSSIVYKRLNDKKESESWSRVAQLQRLLRQYTSVKILHNEIDFLIQEIHQLVRNPEVWPRDVAALEWVGLMCYSLDLHEVAEKYFQQALQEGQSPKSLTMLARFELNRGSLEEAGRHLIALLELRPNDGLALNLYGVYLMQGENFMEAVEVFRKAIEYEGDRKKARLGIGMAYIGMRKTREAWNVFVEAAGENPDDVEVMNWVIRTGTELNDWRSLSMLLSRFVERNLTDCDMRFALASVHVRQGNSQEAQSHLQTLKHLNPEYDGIQDLEHAIDSMGVNLSAIANS